MNELVPFYQPTRVGNHLDSLREAIDAHSFAGDGPFSQRCAQWLEAYLPAPRVLMTPSCTHALEMGALLLDLKPGDEVIVPAYTFVTTANAFWVHGGRPVFVDVRPDTANLDEEQLEAAITPRTRAVVAVHYAGVACAMERINQIAQCHGLKVIEDNAHGLFGAYQGRRLGRWGDLAAMSFHETKNIQCGEGGALALQSAADARRAEIIREKGTNRSQFLRGEVDKYTWVDSGSSYLMGELLAAFLWPQMQACETLQAQRRALWQTYQKGLVDWAKQHGAALPAVPAECEPAYHQFHLIMAEAQQRRALMAHLKEQGIGCAFHYPPLHLSQMGQALGGREGQCPAAELISERLLRLPFYHALTEAQQARVIEAVSRFSA